eukprot:399884-Hanusia_phi.AAC.1
MSIFPLTPTDPEDWQMEMSMNGFQVQLLPRRKRSKYITNSCSECRLKKRKCSNVRPCAMCIVAGTSARCQAESATAPTYTVVRSSQEAWFQDPKDQEISLESLRHACLHVGVNIALVRPFWELGLSASVIFRALRILPLDLKVALDEAIDTARAIALTSPSMVSAQESDKLHKVQEYGRLCHKLGHDDRETSGSTASESSSEDWLDRAWSDAGQCGHGRWISMEYDQKDLAHCRRVRLGDEVEELLGYRNGEMISRHSNHDLLLQVSEYEMLITIMELVFHSFDPQVT